MKEAISFAQRRRLLAPRNENRLSIAVIEPNYSLERVSYMLKHPAFQHFRAASLRLRFADRKSNYYSQRPFVLSRGFDLVHCWNTIPINEKFVTSVEMEFPRLFGNISASRLRRTMQRLESNDCKGIWPLSEAARSYISRRFHASNVGHLCEKLRIFRGAISCLPDSITPVLSYDPSLPLKILFVGGDGLRKGLFPLLGACRSLYELGANITLTIIGSFTETSYIVPGKRFDRQELCQYARSQSWIVHIPECSNAEVRAMMASHHILALPTFDESLGWVPMEAATGYTPTIATNVFAIPEFVRDRSNGWIINLDLDEDLRWRFVGDPRAESHFTDAEAYIEGEIRGIIGEVLNAPNLIQQYGETARKFVQESYSAEASAIELSDLYDSATYH